MTHDFYLKFNYPGRRGAKSAEAQPRSCQCAPAVRGQCEEGREQASLSLGKALFTLKVSNYGQNLHFNTLRCHHHFQALLLKGQV